MAPTRQLRYFPVFLLIVLIGHFCSKPSGSTTSPTTTSPGSPTSPVNNDTNTTVIGLQVFHSASLANTTDTLQAIYAASGSPYKTYVYGSYNSSGAPDSIRSLAVRNQKGDTTANYTFDDSLRLHSMYFTYRSRRDTALITLGYETPGQTKVRSYYYDTLAKSTTLRSVFVVNNASKSIISSQQYAGFGEGIFKLLLLQASVTGQPDPYFSQWLVVQGEMNILSAIQIGGSIGICALALTPLGCAIAAIGLAVLGSNPANASTVDTNTAPPASDDPPDVPSVPDFEVGDYHEDRSMVVSVDNTQAHGLIVSSTDQSAGATYNDALNIASGYSSGGSTDWRLPTSQELATLYYYANLVGNFSTGCTNSNFANCSYWSSTANGNSYIWVMYFNDGVFWNNYVPNAIARVRLVRSF